MDRGDVLLRMASRGKCADKLLTGVAAAQEHSAVLASVAVFAVSTA